MLHKHISLNVWRMVMINFQLITILAYNKLKAIMWKIDAKTCVMSFYFNYFLKVESFNYFWIQRDYLR